MRKMGSKMRSEIGRHQSREVSSDERPHLGRVDVNGMRECKGYKISKRRFPAKVYSYSQLCEMRAAAKRRRERETRETNELIHSAEGETGISVLPKVDLIQLEPSPERSPRCQRRRKVGKYDATRKRNFIYQSAFRINCWVSGDKEPRRHSQNPETYKGLK